jgi:hypothetical protein
MKEQDFFNLSEEFLQSYSVPISTLLRMFDNAPNHVKILNALKKAVLSNVNDADMKKGISNSLEKTHTELKAILPINPSGTLHTTRVPPSQQEIASNYHEYLISFLSKASKTSKYWSQREVLYL